MFTTISIRAKWYFVLVSVVLLAGSFLLYRQGVYSRFFPQDNIPVPFSEIDLDGSYSGGACRQCPVCDVQQGSELQVVKDWDSSKVLMGAPTERFRDNLRNDTGYLTATAASGFTNQFMAYVNMIYLATISDRVPILPPFIPGYHISNQADALLFGQVFNLTYLRNALRRPVLEWSDVKHLPSPTSIANPLDSQREELGCWSTRQEANSQPLRVPSLHNNLRLDVSYTRIPSETRYNPSDPQNLWVVFSKLVPYIFPRNPVRGRFNLLSPSPLGHRLPPDEQLSCFDFLYYTTSSNKLYEWESSWSPPWNSVGTHIRFTDRLVDITKGYLSRAFNVTEGEIPPFIAVHNRRGDFSQRCKDSTTGCLSTLSNFTDKVNEIRETIFQQQNINITQVLFASDEQDPMFWTEVRANGWFYFNHTEERTQEKFGEWFIPMIDIVSHSLAAGFVGTSGSTFSLVSARRVEDWNHGPTTLVRRT